MQEIQHNFNQLYQGEQSKTFDEVDYLLDVTKLRADILELAKKCNTINYEILCTVGKRVPRKFIK